MIIVLSFFWGSFIGVLLHRSLRLVTIYLRDSQVTPSSYLRLQRSSWTYLLLGRSRCDSCGKSISWFQNIPIISYGLLKGKCSNCKASIPKSFWALEWGFLALGIVLYAFVDDLLLQWIYLVTVSLLLMIAVIDWRHQVIPDVLSYLVFWVGVAYLLITSEPWMNHFLCAVFTYGVLKTLQLVYLLLLKKQALGDADPLLGFALGIWLQLEILPYYFLLAAVLTLIGVWVKARFFGQIANPWQQHFPFGPGLVASAILCFLFSRL